MKRELADLRDVWEHAAQTDPHFAVCSDPVRRGGAWDESSFFASGEREVAALLGHIVQRGIRLPAGPALDFGCGLGRLTRTLARHFGEAVGVDLAPTMVSEAARTQPPGCRFVVNDSADLGQFADGEFGFVYSSIVLQHMPPALALGYIGEFVRVLRPDGLAVFQVPSAFKESPLGKLRRRARLRTRIRELMGSRGLEQHRVAWTMTATPEEQVVARVAEQGGHILDRAWTNSTDPDFNGELRILPRAPTHGWVSRQYVVGRR